VRQFAPGTTLARRSQAVLNSWSRSGDDDVVTTFQIVSRRGKPILSVEEWGVEAKPAKAEHWQDGRSAKELAKAWISGRGPAALISLLDRQPATAGFRIECAVAEAQTAFDRWPGGKRNHDLLVNGQAAGGRTVIGLEGKADESFGQTLTSYMAGAMRRIDRNEATNAPQRLKELTVALAGSTVDTEPELGKLRYQLFSAIAGTLAAAEPTRSQAVFVVHEFITDKTTDALHAANEEALAAFVERVFAARPPAGEASWLMGPLHVPAERWADLPLWVGKTSTWLRLGP